MKSWYVAHIIEREISTSIVPLVNSIQYGFQLGLSIVLYLPHSRNYFLFLGCPLACHNFGVHGPRIPTLEFTTLVAMSWLMRYVMIERMWFPLLHCDSLVGCLSYPSIFSRLPLPTLLFESLRL